MDNVVITLIVFVIVVLSSLYIYKSKKNGRKCIGCPYAGSCNNKKDNCEK